LWRLGEYAPAAVRRNDVVAPVVAEDVAAQLAT
jgi:hypothetical protein